MRDLNRFPHMDENIYVRRRRILTLATGMPGLFLAAADSESFLAFAVSKIIAVALMAVAVVLYNTLPESEEEEEEDVR